MDTVDRHVEEEHVKEALELEVSGNAGANGGGDRAKDSTATEGNAGPGGRAPDGASAEAPAAAGRGTGSVEGNAGGGAAEATATATRALEEAAATADVAHHSKQHQDQGAASAGMHAKESVEQVVLTDREAYEASFPDEPAAPRPATTYALFADPRCLDPSELRRCPHHLSGTLGGMAWLDADGDGNRGSETDRALNAREYDTGLGGVEVTLADCATDRLVPGTRATSGGGMAPGGTATALRSEDPTAGGYGWPDLDALGPGRYYAVYAAPRNRRLSGNVLPLARAPSDDGAAGGGACVPRGGEGLAYLAEIRRTGDLDWPGYCARSVGCFDVAPKFELRRRYADAAALPGTDEAAYTGTLRLLAALPSPIVLDVGLAAEPWPLPTYQYADATVTLALPGAASDAELERGRAGVGAALATAFAGLLSEGGEDDGRGFALAGVECREGAVAGEGDGALPAVRRLGEAPAARVTYTITTRGTYRPPPALQLGHILEDSINRDPGLVTRSLQGRNDLPPIFKGVADAGFAHLTLKAPTPAPTRPPFAPGVARVRAAETQGVLAGWATGPLVLLSLLIFGLSVTLVVRRVLSMLDLWKEIEQWRGKTGDVDGDGDDDLFKAPKQFNVAQHRPEDVQSKRNVYDDDGRSAASGRSRSGSSGRSAGSGRSAAPSRGDRGSRGLASIAEEGSRGGRRGGGRSRDGASVRDGGRRGGHLT